jgi:hypothetical protein
MSGTGIHNSDGLKGKVPDELLGKEMQEMTPAERGIYSMKLNSAVFEVYGAIYFISINQFMGNFMNTILVFQGERPVFLRE